MKRPPWLRWQAIRFSPWLVAYLVFWSLVAWVLPVLLEWHKVGGSFGQAYWTYSQRMSETGPTPYLYFSGLAGTVFLTWFTYFSQSLRVKDHDRFAVFLMLCGGVLGGVLILLRVFVS